MLIVDWCIKWQFSLSEHVLFDRGTLWLLTYYILEIFLPIHEHSTGVLGREQWIIHSYQASITITQSQSPALVFICRAVDALQCVVWCCLFCSDNVLCTLVG